MDVTRDQPSAVPQDGGYGIRPPGYRLPDLTRIGRVDLEVADLSRSLAYYEQVLGLHLLGSSGSASLLGAAGDTTPLLAIHERPGAEPVPRGGRLGLFHFAILLPDRASLGRFVTHLGRLGVRMGASDHLVSEAIYLYDPDGLGIEVYADRPRSTWQHAGRQLLMASEPLDLGDLARAAGDVPWGGMPPGTTMGHIHLHVGDLEVASRFYHEGLGLDRIVWSYPGALFLSAGGYHHHLGVNTWAAGAAPARDGHARLARWQLRLPSRGDVSEALKSLQRAGYPAKANGAGEEGEAGTLISDPWEITLALEA